jgi:SAM-dependent methyltransferase
MLADSILSDVVPCDLCGAEDQVLLYSKIDPITGGEFHLVECSCGMAFVNPMPSDESVPLLYPEDYLKDKQGMGSLYGRMMELLPKGDGGKLLDIGCGRGDFIQYAAQRGWEAEGVDLLAWDTPHKVAIRVGDFVTMDLPEDSYDVITAWALLEHVRRPSSFFNKISRLLKKNGHFVFVVSNFAAPGMRRSCTEDIPRHLQLFSPLAVESYLNKYEMKSLVTYHNDRIYSCYPFGLLRYGFLGLTGDNKQCVSFQNRSVALLRNRQIKGNARTWLSEVLRSVRPVDILLDAIDLALGVALAKYSKMIGNYGVLTVVATPNRQKKSNPF